MASVFKIHDTVLKVSTEALALLPEAPVIKDESKLLSELVLCILSSQEKYEVALAIMKSLQKENTLRIPKNRSDFKDTTAQIKNILRMPVDFQFNGKNYSRRLRFYTKKAQYINDTLENIYLNKLTIKKILNQKDCINETRKNIINYSTGIGPKQASMFLRNIGYYSEFAVLDKHVLDYMRLMGLINISGVSFSSILVYQKIENKLKSYADTYKVNLLHLDLAIWTTMRTLKSITNETCNLSIGRY
jgi:N-glycosylase/DNA lyase